MVIGSKAKTFFDKYYFLIFTYCISFFPAFFKIGVTFSDSPSYINNTIFVAPFYGYFIDVLQFILGEKNYKWIAITQYILFFHVLFYFLIKLSKLLNLEEAQRLLFIFILGIAYSQYTSIQTEAVAYPIFFAAVYSVLDIIKKVQFSKYLWLLFFVTILCLIRAQYIFLFPLGFVALLIFRKKMFSIGFIKVWGVFFLAFIISLFATNSVNYLRYGKFIGPQLFGLNFISTPAYLMQKEDINLFNDELTKKIFVSSLEELQRENAVKYCDKTKWQKPSKEDFEDIAKNFTFWKPEFWRGYYQAEFEQKKERSYKIEEGEGVCKSLDIKHFVDTTAARFHSFLIAAQNNDITDLESINKVTTSISLKIIEAKFIDWIKYGSLVSLLDFAGGSFIFIILFAILIILNIINKAGAGDRYFKNIYIYLGFMLHISNSFFVGFISMAHPRYVQFTMAILLSALLIEFYDTALKLVNKFRKKA